MTIFLEDEEIYLSPFTSGLAHGSAYLDWINDQGSDTHTQHALFPHTDLSLSENFNRIGQSADILKLGICLRDNDMHVGNIEIANIDFINRTGTYNIIVGNKNCQGKGVGYRASVLILKHAFERLSLNRIQLGVLESNNRALALYRKLGFKEEGRFEQAILVDGFYFDVIRMRILRSEFKSQL